MESASLKKNEELYALFIIVNAGYSVLVTDLLRDNGAGGATILNARGAGAKHEVFMGITIDTEKEIVLSVVTAQVARAFMAQVREMAEWRTKLRGICFTLPVEATTGININPTDSLRR